MYLLGIIVIEFEYQTAQLARFIYALLQLAPYERQLKTKEIYMTCFEIMQQGGYRQLSVILKVSMTVDGIVHHRKKGIGIHAIVFAGLIHSFVTKAKIDAKTSQRLQQVVVVFNERYHFIACLIYLLDFHSFIIMVVYLQHVLLPRKTRDKGKIIL